MTNAKDARIAELEAALKACRQGYSNILEFHRLPSGKYGSIKREELEIAIEAIDAALEPKR